jgi:hypothetical protein
MKSNVVFRPTVVIGLGGTGYGAIVKLKRRFIDTYASVPPIIRFLSIDTTENAEGTDRESSNSVLDHGERYVISVANPAALVDGPNEHINEWWPKNIPVNAIVAGAGQVRARGRLALFAKSSEVFAKIRHAIDDVRNIRNQKQMYADQFQVSTRPGVEVYIVSSLAGGTGSGIFLDVSFIARSIIGSDENSNFTGVLLLPRLFTQYSGTHLVRSNAYGALKEIEHLTSPKFRINYGNREIDVTRPPFDLVYLIDSINEQGRVVSEQSDLLGLIADGLYVQIGSQIGADSANAVDNIKTHMATIGTVKGKSPRYCSFGVASLVLPRFEAAIYDDGKRLVNDEILGGSDTDADIEVEVSTFLDEQRLREDNADQLIDALIEREGGGRVRHPMQLGQMRFDTKSLTSIKNLHTVHRAKAERAVAQIISANFDRIKDTAGRALLTWFSEAVAAVQGLQRCERFIQKLQAKFDWYQQMMECEADQERVKLKALSFKQVEGEIQNAVGAWIGREAKVKTACDSYRGAVDRETELMAEVARREKAAELYSALSAGARRLLDRCTRVRQNVEAVGRAFEQKYLAAASERGVSHLFEQTVRFDLAANKPIISGDDFVKWYRDELGAISNWSEMKADDVAREIETFLFKRYEKLTSLTIDDVLSKTDPSVVSEDLNRVSNLAVPLWRYESGRIPVVSTSIISEFYHYGVSDAESTVLKDAKIRAGVPRGTAEPTFVSTRDGRRVLIFKVKTGIPLFALYDIDDLEQAYREPSKAISNHVDARWEDLTNLIPRSSDGEALRWFAVAQEPDLFNLISMQGTWYSIRSRTGRRTDANMVRLAQGRVQAYQTFEKRKELVDETEAAVETILAREGASRVKDILKKYTVMLASKPVNDSAVRDQLEAEIGAIEDYIRRIETVS